MSKFPNILIVPMKKCIAHEGVVTRWVDGIANNLLDEGTMKNPIIVTKADRRGRRIVIDGMHRFAALRQLEVRDILVHEIDYTSTQILLAGWDALTFRPFKAGSFLKKVFEGKAFKFTTTRNAKEAQRAVDNREALLATSDGGKIFHLMMGPKKANVETCVRTSQQVDTALDSLGYRPLYVADSLSLSDFRRMKASGIIIRPHYTKEEITSRTLSGKLFPRKSTRHSIPGRPLRVDVGIPLLRAKISLKDKNRLLEEHLRWCYESDRIRFYPEPVFIFAD